MGNFDFNMEGESFSSQSYLKPYTINEVKLTKFEVGTLKGVKNPDTEYKIITIEFTGTDKNPGIFSTNLFFPTAPDGLERPKFKNQQGHEYENPSRFEQFKYTLSQLVAVLAPEKLEIVKKKAGAVKTLEDFVEIFSRVLNAHKDVVTNLKLVGRNSNGTVYASLPQACGLSKDGKLYAKNFVGNNLTFTAYEMQQSKALNNAKPTDVEKENEASDDLGDLLSDL